MQMSNCMLMIPIYFYLILMQIILILMLKLKELNTWFEINKLSLNIEKTCYMVFSSSPKIV